MINSCAYVILLAVLTAQFTGINGGELVTIYCARYPGVLPELCPQPTDAPTTTEETEAPTTTTVEATTSTSTTTTTTPEPTTTTTPPTPPTTKLFDYKYYEKYCLAYLHEYTEYCQWYYHNTGKVANFKNLDNFCPGYRKVCQWYIDRLTTPYRAPTIQGPIAINKPDPELEK